LAITGLANWLETSSTASTAAAHFCILFLHAARGFFGDALS
jgi:hypothetical protein